MKKEFYSSEIYYIKPWRDLIIDPFHELVIEVIPPEDEIELDSSEVQYYGSDYGEPLIFQTVGYRNQLEFFIESAIIWYATVPLDYPDMKLSKYPL
jgi:hypothetical protein